MMIKKLILISALLFSFNGWAKWYTDRPAINLVCKQTKVTFCSSKINCNASSTEMLMMTNPELVNEDVGISLRETTVDVLWAMTVDSKNTRFAPLENNIIKFSDAVPKAGDFAGKRVTYSLNIITGIHVYEVYDIEESYAALKIDFQCSKQQSLLD